MKNIEEAPQHEMVVRATGNRQGAAETWQVNYVPYSGGDAPFIIGEVKVGGIDVEMSCPPPGNCQGGAESWEINYVPFSGEVLGSRRGDDVKLSNPPNTAAGQDGEEKSRSSYVPFSPPSSFPWKTIEDESSSKGLAGGGGDRGEVQCTT